MSNKTGKKSFRRVYCMGQKSFIVDGIFFAVCVIGIIAFIMLVLYYPYGKELLFSIAALFFAVIGAFLSFGDNMSFIVFSEGEISKKNFYGMINRKINVSDIKYVCVVMMDNSPKEAYFLLCKEHKAFDKFVNSDKVLRDKDIICYRVTQDSIKFTESFYFGKIEDPANFIYESKNDN